MTVKEFFKSTAFKCIITLLCVLLISGIFLTVMNGLLEVSEEERFQRDLAKIYGAYVDTEEIDILNETTQFENSSIVVAYKVSDGNYLIKSTGKQGYGGDVTCWVVVIMTKDGKAIEGVGNVIVGSDPNDAKGESFLSNITSSHLAEFSKISYTDGFVYELGYKNDSEKPGDNYLATGASKTMRAISNAVNGAISYVKVHALGATIDISTPYDDFAYIDYINKNETTVSYKDGIVNFNVVTTGNGEANAFTINIAVNGENKIESYEIVKNGSTYGFESSMMEIDFIGKSAEDLEAMLDDGSLTTGATKSNTLCLQAALFAASNYTNALKLSYEYTDFINLDETSWTIDSDSVAYEIVTKTNGEANAFTINVTVNGDKKIENFEIIKNGSTYGFESSMMEINFIGKSVEDLEAMLDDGSLTTGATKSNTLCLQAALFAAYNYDLSLLTGGGNNE